MQYIRAQYITDSRYGNLRTIVGSGYGKYFLQYSPNADIYVAGCRFFTPKQALKHWRAVSKLNPKDEPIVRIQRAKAFVKAIEEHQLSLKKGKPWNSLQTKPLTMTKFPPPPEGFTEFMKDSRTMTNPNDTPSRTAFNEILSSIETSKAEDKKNTLLSLLQKVKNAVANGFSFNGEVSYPCPGITPTPGEISVAISADYLGSLKEKGLVDTNGPLDTDGVSLRVYSVSNTFCLTIKKTNYER